jgi:hypothetical protein
MDALLLYSTVPAGWIVIFALMMRLARKYPDYFK